MRDTIRKILSEDMDWVSAIPSALPTIEQIREKTVNVPLSLEQIFSVLMEHYVTLVFDDGRVVELTSSYRINYDTYQNWEEFDDGTGNDINSLEDYLNEYTVEPMSETTNPLYIAVGGALRDIFPDNITEIYFGDL